MPFRDLDVLDAAERLAERVNALVDGADNFLHAAQIRRSAAGIGASISEGFGRREGAERKYRLEIARGEAEETISWLRSNSRSNRITSGQYWPIHNLLVTIVKMLTSLIKRRS